MFRVTRAQLLPIGLDIGRDAIKMLQLEVVGNHVMVRAAARKSLPAEAGSDVQGRLRAAAEVVRGLLRQGGFSGRRVVAALPRELVHVKSLRLPQMPVAELEQAAMFEAQHLFPFELDEALVRCLPAGEVRQGSVTQQEVIVLAARSGDVNAFVEAVHQCGVVLESLDAEPCALYRSVERFMRRREDEQEVHVLVDVGLSSSRVVIGKGKEISFLKSVELGCRHMHEAIAQELGISQEEALGLRRRLLEGFDAGDAPEQRDPVRQAVIGATRSVMEQLGRELSLCLRYFSVTFRGQRPSRLRLVGGGAADAQLHSVLGSMLTIRVEAGRPLYSVDTSRMKAMERRGTMSEWAMALGLGLRGTTGYFGARDGKPRDLGAPAMEAPRAAGLGGSAAAGSGAAGEAAESMGAATVAGTMSAGAGAMGAGVMEAMAGDAAGRGEGPHA